MADQLVTQVSQGDDPAKQQAALAAARKLAEEKKAAEAAAKEAKDKEAKAEAEDKSSCWRMFCCLCRRPRKPASVPPKQAESGSSAPVSSAGATAPRSSAKGVLEKVPESTKWLLPPQREDHKGRKTLVLDLDETLVHSSFRPVPSPDFIITIELDGVSHKVYVQKRPGVDEFLEAVAKKFEVVVFTASLDKYANPVLDTLDPKGFCTGRLFREACVQHYGNYVKDLSLLGRELKHSLIIDNSPFSYLFQQDNAIPITSWFNDKNDRELYDLLPFLNQTIAEADDVSQVIVDRKQLVMDNQQVGGAMMGEEEDEEGG
jgi:Dullard-like phosphatase family protein